MLPGIMGRPMDAPLKSRLISLLAVVLGGSAANSLHRSAESCRPMQGQRSCPQLGLINRPTGKKLRSCERDYAEPQNIRHKGTKTKKSPLTICLYVFLSKKVVSGQTALKRKKN